MLAYLSFNYNWVYLYSSFFTFSFDSIQHSISCRWKVMLIRAYNLSNVVFCPCGNIFMLFILKLIKLYIVVGYNITLNMTISRNYIWIFYLCLILILISRILHNFYFQESMHNFGFRIIYDICITSSFLSHFVWHIQH